MSRAIKRDVAASVRARLLKLAGPDMSFERLLVRYAIERLLFRLEISEYANRFVLKGAQLFLVWTGNYYRSTRDVDLLGRDIVDTNTMIQVWKDICAVTCPDDGLVFHPESVRAEDIRAVDEYAGIRVNLDAVLSKARIHLQVDIGFGDAVLPRPAKVDFPVLLDMPCPRPLAYQREVVVAEKFEAIVKLGLVNTRLKDYYDLWAMAADFEFRGEVLARAMIATFKRRKSPLPRVTPPGLTEAYFDDADRVQQWNGFLRRGTFLKQGPELKAICIMIREFIMPVSLSAVDELDFAKQWSPGGPWLPED